MPIWLTAGLWGLLGASSLLLGAAVAFVLRMPRYVTAGIMSFGCGVLISVNRLASLALTQSWCSSFHSAPTNRAWSRSIFPRPYIWRLTSLRRLICPSVCPFDQGDVIAARTAAWSLPTPLANEATRLARARSIQGARPASVLRRIIRWNSAMISRASTRVGTPASIAATVTVSALVSRSRPIVIEASDRSGRRNPLKVLCVGPFRSSSAGCPLADDTERASEATPFQTAPKFSTVAAARRPLLVQPWQVHIQRTLPGSEHVVTFAADHLSHQLPAVAGLTHDLLDRYAILRQSQDDRVGLLAAQIALILEALSGGE